MSGGGAGWLFRGGRIVPEERHQTGSANQGDFWKLEEHKPGVQSFTHFADGTAHKNRMQGNDFVKSVMYTRGVTCFSCHDVHGTDNPAVLWKPANRICLDCHGPGSPTAHAGPRSRRTPITSLAAPAASASPPQGPVHGEGHRDTQDLARTLTLGHGGVIWCVSPAVQQAQTSRHTALPLRQGTNRATRRLTQRRPRRLREAVDGGCCMEDSS